MFELLKNQWGSFSLRSTFELLKNQWGSFSCYAAHLSFSRNQWGSFSCYAAHLSFSRTNEVHSRVTHHVWASQEPMRFILVLRSTFELLKNQWGSFSCYASRLNFSRTNEVYSRVTHHVWASARTSEVHSRVTQQVWASARTNEVCSRASNKFGWASFYVCLSLYVNKSLNLICWSYKAIVSLQKIWTKPLNLNGSMVVVWTVNGGRELA